MKLIKPLFYCVLFVSLLFIILVYLGLSASLPNIDQSFANAGVTHETSIGRDALGSVQIKAKDFDDAAFALGYAHAQDSILVSFSMYLDLQRAQVDRDLVNTVLLDKFGYGLLPFLNLPSPYQAALDSSVVSESLGTVPSLNIDSSVSSIDSHPLF